MLVIMQQSSSGWHRSVEHSLEPFFYTTIHDMFHWSGGHKRNSDNICVDVYVSMSANVCVEGEGITASSQLNSNFLEYTHTVHTHAHRWNTGFECV